MNVGFVFSLFSEHGGLEPMGPPCPPPPPIEWKNSPSPKVGSLRQVQMQDTESEVTRKCTSSEERARQCLPSALRVPLQAASGELEEPEG